MKEMAFEADKLALIKTQNEQAKAFALTDTFDARATQLHCIHVPMRAHPAPFLSR
jgi:hypothetical protein